MKKSLSHSSIAIAASLVLVSTLGACSETKPSEQKSVAANTSPESQALKQQVMRDLVFVEGGTFVMGDAGFIDPKGEKHYWSPDSDDKVTRNVTLTSYSIQKYEVLFKDFDYWTKLTGKPLIHFDLRNHASYQASKPAKNMTWFEARDYCLFLAELTGAPFSLPTEAQWEYAARSRGLNVPYATDNGQREKGRNVKDTAQGNSITLKPGSFPPNPLGLYDMTGNVNEWVLDWYTRRYPFEDEIDPTGPTEEQNKKWKFQHRIARGGGLAGGDANTVYRRTETKPTNNGAGIGIRCVVNQATPVNTATDP